MSKNKNRNNSFENRQQPGATDKNMQNKSGNYPLTKTEAQPENCKGAQNKSKTDGMQG